MQRRKLAIQIYFMHPVLQTAVEIMAWMSNWTTNIFVDVISCACTELESLANLC